jgi:hypothetical protein
MDLVLQYQHWLDETCIQNGKRNFKWSTGELTTVIPKIRTFGSGNYPLGEYYEFANVLYFSYEEDLLAFRLRWGIQDTMCRQ